MADKQDKASTRPDAARPNAARFIDAKRRGFLQGATLAAGAAASGGTLAAAPVPEPVSEAAGKPLSGGYRETDHVREYYAKARF